MTPGYVLSLCDRTGNMVRPWLEAGYRAVTVDLQEAALTHPLRKHLMVDVRDAATIYEAIGFERPLCTFAFPPCTHLASSGARWWEKKGLGAFLEGLEVVDACRRMCEALGAPWCLENPVGALSTHWRRPDHTFDPADFAGYSPSPDLDAYTKRTCFWVGHGFRMPRRRPVLPRGHEHIHMMPDRASRGDDRSVTPLGFAYGVFEANNPVDRVLADNLEELAQCRA